MGLADELQARRSFSGDAPLRNLRPCIDGNMSGRGAVGRHGYLPDKSITFNSPVTLDQSIRGLVFASSVAHISTGRRLQDDVFETRVLGIGADASDIFIGVVVEGVHSGIMEAVVFGPAIPTLPDGCSAMNDRVQPGWEGFLEQQRVGQVKAPNIGEHLGNIWGADESSGHVHLAGDFNILDERGDDGGSQVFGDQIEVQSQYMSRLSLASYETIGGDEAFDESGARIFEELAKFVSVIGRKPGRQCR